MSLSQAWISSAVIALNRPRRDRIKWKFVFSLDFNEPKYIALLTITVRCFLLMNQITCWVRDLSRLLSVFGEQGVEVGVGSGEGVSSSRVGRGLGRGLCPLPILILKWLVVMHSGWYFMWLRATTTRLWKAERLLMYYTVRGVYPPTTKALFPNFPLFPFLPLSPFSLPSPSPSPSFHSLLLQSGPLETSYRGSGGAVSSPVGSGAKPQPTSILLYSEREKLIWQQLLYEFLYIEIC